MPKRSSERLGKTPVARRLRRGGISGSTEMDDLESEIAGALTSSAITSSELARLIEQVITAAAAADEAAAQERARALDPAVVVDTQAVSAAIVAAELRRDRLNAALPRLQTRCAKVDAAERYARWILDYDKVRGQRD